VKGKREKLIDGLGAGIAPAGMAGRPKHKIAIFAEGKLGRLAVDLGGGREHSAARVRGGNAQQQLGSGNVVLDGCDRRLNDVADTDGCGEVVDDVTVGDERRKQLAIKDGSLAEDELRMIAKVGKVV
jgi:hypothetical protein